ncbi:Uncharacterised protein [uncultured archaeon]|nr:Uncharacterised protein [uncultured archaeon]
MGQAVPVEPFRSFFPSGVPGDQGCPEKVTGVHQDLDGPIYQYSLIFIGISENHSDLTIFNFAQSAAILPLYAYRVISLFWEPCLINMEGALNRISYHFCYNCLDLILDNVKLYPVWKASQANLMEAIWSE